MKETSDDDIEAAVVVPPEDVDRIRAIAEDHGVSVEVQANHGFEPISTITIILFGSVAALGAVQQIIDERKGGLVIDLRPGAPRREHRDRDVKYGLVLVYTADGYVRIEVHEPKGMFGAVVEAVRDVTIEVGKATVQAVNAGVRAAVGDRASTTSTEVDGTIDEGDGRA